MFAVSESRPPNSCPGCCAREKVMPVFPLIASMIPHLPMGNTADSHTNPRGPCRRGLSARERFPGLCRANRQRVSI